MAPRTNRHAVRTGRRVRPYEGREKTREDAKRREFADTGWDGAAPINTEKVTLNRENVG